MSVAVPIPFLDPLTYRLPDEFAMPARGARVLVPLGARVVTGCVIGFPDEAEPTRVPRKRKEIVDEDPGIRAVIDILDETPFVPPHVVDLAVWVAEYYSCGVGEAIAAAMPPYAWVVSRKRITITDLGRTRLAGGELRGKRAAVLRCLSTGKGSGALFTKFEKRAGIHALLGSMADEGLIVVTRALKGSARAFKTVRVASLTAQGHEYVDHKPEAHSPSRVLEPEGENDGQRSLPIPGGRLSAKQQEVLSILRGSAAGVPLGTLAGRSLSTETVRRLAARGLLSIRQVRIERDPFGDHSSSPAAVWGDSDSLEGSRFELTAEQAPALQRLMQLAHRREFHVALLHGVTGSGKTEIYLRLAEAVRRTGRGVLILVPEIALTPAVAAAFRARFGDRVAIQHSGLSDGKRHDQWQRIRRGDVDLVIGTRSAVFAPLTSLGLVVADEEHDASYKQEESPRYHARDVAVMRAKQAGALAVLGSATPSLESYQNAVRGRYERIGLERRIFDRPLASVQIVDMREEYAANGPEVVLSGPLRDALAERLANGEQALVLLNRRGFATAVFCRQCAGTIECPNCSVALTVHRAARRARCHYCNYSTMVPRTCPVCVAPYLEQMGFGTERVEAELMSLFPAARIARLDRDTARPRGAAARLLGRFGARELDILVGTQMIAKGHDFPGVTLVGVISADVGLGLPDFRAAERTFQLLTQVAGRAGRGEIGGTAIVQTLFPNHYSIRHACSQHYAAFFEEEIRFRRAMRYPPIVGLINTVVRARTLAAAMEDAGELVLRLRAGPQGFRVLGPAPAPLGKLRGEHRAQFFLKGDNRARMRDALGRAVAAHPELRRRVTIDVDPLSVL